MIPGTNKDVDIDLKKLYEVLFERNKIIVSLMSKIDEIKGNHEFLQDDLKNCFKDVAELSKSLTIEPSSIVFLKPYL